MLLQYSGSCALVLLIFDDICYLASLGNSKAILSMDEGKQNEVITKDHTPKNKNERQRIQSNGGQIYEQQLTKELQELYNLYEPITRILPGKLTVSRTVGDGQAKLAKFGGTEGVIICKPDIIQFQIAQTADFIVLGCIFLLNFNCYKAAGLFQKLQPDKIIKEILAHNKTESSLHSQCSLIVEELFNLCFHLDSLDNISIILIAFDNFNKLYSSKLQTIKDSLKEEANTMSSYTPKHSFQLSQQKQFTMQNNLIKITENCPQPSQFRINSFKTNGHII